MNIPFQINLFSLIQIVTAGFCIVIALNIFGRKEVDGAVYLALLMTSLGIWALSSGLELAALTPNSKLTFAKIMYVGVQSVPPLLFLFSANYSGRKSWLNLKHQIFLWIIPAITIFLVFTNEYHQLIWRKIEPVQDGSHLYHIYHHGIWFWISSSYHYCLMLISSIWFVNGAKEKKNKQNFWQITIILFGLTIAWAANLAYILGYSPIPGLDLTPISFFITVLLVSLAIYPLKFLDISPIARSKLVDMMSDAFFVLDEANILVDINPTGQQLIDSNLKELIGKPAEIVLKRWPKLTEQIQAPVSEKGHSFILQVSEKKWFDVHISPLSKDQKNIPGKLIVLRDISQSKVSEIEIEHQAAGLRKVSEISLSIAANNHPQNLMQDVVDLTAERFDFDYVQIFLNDPVEEILRLEAGSGEVGKKLQESSFYLPLSTGQSIVSWVANHKEAMIVNNVHQEEKYLFNPVLPNTQSEMAVPIFSRDGLLGILDIQSNQIDHFSDNDIHILNTLAAQISISLLNARLIEDLHTRAREAETLRRVISAVTATLDQDEAIARILEQLKIVVPYDSSSVQLLRGDYLEIVGGLGFPDINQVLGLKIPAEGNSPSAIVLNTKGPLILEDAQDRYDAFSQEPHHHTRGWLGVPLIVQNEAIGIISLDSIKPKAFNQSQARLVQAFADHVAIALENARLFEDTRRLATTDPLTNILNRRHFYELAHTEFERSCRYHHQLSAIMFDLDHFKQINDNFGHASGDRVLQIVADTIRVRLRKSDIFGRYGGEEFVIVMPETDTQRAWNVAERLRRSIARTPIILECGKISITISLGVSTLQTEALVSQSSIDVLEKLIDHADQALYKAKQAGRNQVVVYHE